MMTRAEAARLLGVRPDADSAKVTQAFRALARQHHPDAGGRSTEFDRLVRARRTLTTRRAPTHLAPITFERSWAQTRRRHRRHVAALARRIGLKTRRRVR